MSKQLCQDYKQTIDWNRSPALETETFAQTFSYDAMNRPINISQPDNSLIAHSYNKAGLLETVKARLRGSTSWTDFVRDINYNEKGQRTEVYFANDSKTAYTYDDKTFRLTRLLTTRYKGRDVLQDLNYEYDPVGNITRLMDDAQQTFYFDNAVIAPESRYTYDALYRLTEATGREMKALAMPTHNDFANNIALPNPASNALQNYTQQYTYDALGNIQRMQSKGYWTRDYFYNTGVNSLKGHTSGVTAYTYDEHGNTLTMPHLSRIKWDYANRLQHADLGGGGNAYYVYDTNGERVRKVIEKGTVVEERIYLGGWEVYRKTISGNLNFERESLCIMDDRKAIAQIETKTVESGREVPPLPNIRYQYDNHLGSACLELDENAAIITYEEYHPFGTTSYRSGRTETEVSLKRYKYVGKERDEGTGLYYYGARYYAGWLGRFVSVDALANQFPQFSPYVYSNDNPLHYTDPTGMQSEDEVDSTHNNTEPILLDPVIITAEKPVLEQSKYWDIETEEFRANIRANLNDPSSINQGGPAGEGTYFCGFSAFLSYFVENDPEKYVDFMMNLYNTGQASAGEKTFETNQTLYDAIGNLDYKGLKDNKANQMMFLTLAENYDNSTINWFNKNYNKGDEASEWASTTLLEFKTMMNDFGYDVSVKGTDMLNGLNYFQTVDKALKNNKDVILYLNSPMLKDNKWYKNWTGTHYMRIDTIEKLTNGNYEFNMWDYGKWEKRKMSKRKFNFSTYGVITVN